MEDKELVAFAQFVSERIIDRFKLNVVPDYYFMLFQFRHPELNGNEMIRDYDDFCEENKYPRP